MIRLALHQNDFLACTKHYLSVYNTPTMQGNPDQGRAVLQNVLIFCVLAPYDNEQSDLLARVVRTDPVKNDEMGWVGGFVKRFTDGELMRWPMVQQIYGSELRATDIFAIDQGDGKGQERWETLAKRVTEHVTTYKFMGLTKQNIRVVAKYFTRIRMDRLSTFLDLSEQVLPSYSGYLTAGIGEVSLRYGYFRSYLCTHRSTCKNRILFET